MKTAAILITLCLALSSAYATSEPVLSNVILEVSSVPFTAHETISPSMIDPNTNLPLPAIKVDIEKYSVQLTKERYCPNAPSEEAVECARSYDLSQNVSQILLSPEVKSRYEKYDRMLKVTKCSMQKVPHLKASLKVYCYVKGVKKHLKMDFEEVDDLETYKKLLDELENMIEEESRPSFKDFLIEILESLETHRSDIEAIEKVSAEDMTGVSSEMNNKVFEAGA